MEKYDKTNPKSIEEYAQQLIGHTFGEVASWNMPTEFREEIATYEDKARKGGLGNLIEEQFFGYKANSDERADFPEAGVELKVTPFEKTKKGTLRAGERLVLTMISYDKPIEPSLYQSHLWNKCKLLLLIYYLRDKALLSNMNYMIHFAKLFTPPEEDLKIIEEDYKLITEKVSAGKAHELSESDTMYLGACTKGSTVEKSTVPQTYYAPETKAMKRAFCYKNSYMTYVLNNYIVPNAGTVEKIIKSSDDLENKSFDNIIMEKIEKYVGQTDRSLSERLGKEYNKSKNQWSELAFGMLGIKSNKAEEFEKANIVVKTIRLKENGKMPEHISLPPIKFSELVDETWEESSVFNYFNETKFLLVIYQQKGDSYILKGAQMWNMPFSDLEEIVKPGWINIQKSIKDGLILTKKETSTGVVIENSLPKPKDNLIIHMRPHTSKRYYRLSSGEVIGNGTEKDSDTLPDGQIMPKQSFWINKEYMLSQLRDDLKANP